ncbi:MAG: sulfite exporter TauE/SafE family protein [Planctomycetota bacterium]
MFVPVGFASAVIMVWSWLLRLAVTIPRIIVIESLEMLTIGAVAGVLGGLLGVGGGLVMIPAMVVFLGDRFGTDSIHLYKLAAITTSIVVSIPAAARHHQAGAIVFRMLLGIIPLALVGAVVGVVAASYLTGEYSRTLKQAFGVFLELVVVTNVFQAWWTSHGEASLVSACPVPERRGLIGLVVGWPAGLIAGLLGIGGGAWAVPAQRMCLGIRLRNAIANSSCMIVAVATVTAISQSLAVGLTKDAGIPGLQAADGWWLALWLAPGALIGGWCGAGLTHRLPTRWLRLAFHALLAVTGVRLICG